MTYRSRFIFCMPVVSDHSCSYLRIEPSFDSICLISVHDDDNILNSSISRVWEIEEPLQADPFFTEEEKKCLAHDYSQEYIPLLTEEETKAKVDALSNKIREVIEHYKQVDPVGMPGAPVQDPMPIPDMKHSRHLTTLVLKNASVHGLSKFRVDHIYSNLASMQVEAAFRYVKLEVHGNYTLSSVFTRSSGGFNVSLVGVLFEGVALLEVARLGNLEATDINMDIAVTDIQLDFQNLGFLGSLFQGMINTVGPFIFDSIKPYMLTEVNTNVRGEINTHLKSLKQTFPNSIPPLDLAIAEIRKFVRSRYDPYKLEDYKRTKGFLSLDLVEIWVTGLASFYRTGNVSISVTNNTLSIGSHLSTKRLKGSCQWEVSGGIVSTGGFTSFTIEYLQIEAKINQSLNVRNSPKLQDFQMKLGNIQLRMDGLGTMDYVLEFMANILPNILRYQIVDAGEGILKQRIQDFLNTIDVEKEIESHLQKIDDVIGPNNSTTFLDPPETDLYMEDLMDDLD